MKKYSLSTILVFISVLSMAQPPSGHRIHVEVQTDSSVFLHSVSIVLMKTDSSVVRLGATDKNGAIDFDQVAAGEYILKASHTGYKTQFLSPVMLTGANAFEWKVRLAADEKILVAAVVTTKKPMVQFLADKTVVNVDAVITNAGATVMDVLERSPGVSVGRDGTIIMKGKPSVMVLIDGKQTQLNGSELQAYLSGISASQIESIELIDNPGARYDAAGNAGIINIKTKTIKQRGFNGNLSLSFGQGFYWKSNNSLNLNYRTGTFNFFLNYGNRVGYEKMNLYALRKYFDQDGNDSLYLNQPNFNKTRHNAHNLKFGVDVFAGKQTTIGAVFTGNLNKRNVHSSSTIDWMSPNYEIDSTINTLGTRNVEFERTGVNLNAKHVFPDKSELLADIDFINFGIDGDQLFRTQLSAMGSPVQITKGIIPSDLEILTAKIDYSRRFNNFLWEAGIKTASTKTDNLAQYQFYDGASWLEDLSRSNHFLYDEKIHSAYSSVDAETGKWHWQLGLRYELTKYKANQLGNSVVKDSSFQREYGSLFPSAFVSYAVDSNNTLTLRFGRRIDRPQFQNLNPFLVTINKYTFESGNPFIQPQYTWKVEMSHAYKQILSTTVSYSYLKDYFSQIFIIDSNSANVNKNTIIYTRGNVGTFHNFGSTATVQLPITKWWNITGVAVYNHKVIKGVVWVPLEARIHQLNVSLNNQFQFKKGWAAEVSGYYQTNSQIDLQEWLTPQGEMGFGVSKQVLKTKGTLRFTVRDLFYTQNYSGYSTFQNSDEPFEVKWDSRVFRLTFSWRFGKPMKAIRRSSGGATEETERVGSGG